jgi:hypothetical protein
VAAEEGQGFDGSVTRDEVRISRILCRARITNRSMTGQRMIWTRFWKICSTKRRAREFADSQELRLLVF